MAMLKYGSLVAFVLILLGGLTQASECTAESLRCYEATVCASSSNRVDQIRQPVESIELGSEGATTLVLIRTRTKKFKALTSR